ncbi:MAG TPA: DNA repair protein RadC [Chthonomonadaceae bacterium]|nr:DNA repair protein RadC [Chthonomonadaceae bacterium]
MIDRSSSQFDPDSPPPAASVADARGPAARAILRRLNGAAADAEDPAQKAETIRYDLTIKERAPDERPRERLKQFGASTLSNTELLAIQLRTGSSIQSALGLAGELLHAFGGLRGLATAQREELTRVRGIGDVKATEICAAIELGRRLSALTADDKPCIRSPQDVSNLLMAEMRDLKKEHLRSLLLDTKHRVMRVCTVSIGTLDSSLVHPREVFKDAILASAAAIIVVHNHPSGDPSPSAEDRRITTRLHECGQLLGIELLDHIILGDNRHVSLKERGVF